MKRRDLLLGAGAIATSFSFSSVSVAGASGVPPISGVEALDFAKCVPSIRSEPDIEAARLWWPEPRNVWTPIGWKDHLFRFNSVYNGTLLCSPGGWHKKPDTAKYRGNDFQLNFTPSADGELPPMPTEYTKLYKTDGGIGMQAWRVDKETPVLQTDWPCQEGVVMRQEVFAHLKGGKQIQTGVEPLYAWIRLSVSFVHPIRPSQRFSFGIQLSRVYYDVASTVEDTMFLAINPKKPTFAESLTSSVIVANNGGKPGLSIFQKDLTRMQVLPGGDGTITLRENATHSIYDLIVDLPAQVGAHTDILVPMLPEPADTIQSEVNVGFDGALAQCEQFWNFKPATAARIHTPENYINHAINRNIQFAQIIAERNPDTGDYSFLTGSYGYDALWSTPTSMVSHMFLDLLGYHDVVEKHVEIYKKYQGTVKPPGTAYTLHPGYFSTPKTLTSINWLSDHGAILEVLSRHALLTGRQAFIEEWIGPILKGCDFIKDSCAITDGPGVKGVMPPAVATDSQVPIQAIWSEAWTYKGLMSSVAMLKTMNHPRTSEFEHSGASFQAAFETGFRERMPKEPEWTDPQGNSHRILPTDLIPPLEHHVFDDAFLLDTGPLVLPWAALFDASDPAMESFGDFFRVGPNNELRGPQSGNLDRAVLRHEISSCETCYSWNIVNSWKLGDRDRFLEGMYSLFAGGISPQTYINCEHRNAMYGNIFAAPLMTWCMRQAVVDDQLADGELHLLRLCPQAWLSSEEESVFENMPTLFGVVNLRFNLSKDGKTLSTTFNGKWRERPRRISLHIPPVAGITSVTVNGRHRQVNTQVEMEVL
jgi:hypothetical protein